MKLPPSTVVYNGHEYTAGSAKFGLSIEPHNADLQRLAHEAAQGDTIGRGYTIGDEMKWNVFVRIGEDVVRKAAGCGVEATDAEVVGRLREMKNRA